MRYGVGVKSWERYSCLGILKKAKYAQCAHEAMEMLEEVNQHVLSIVAQVIAQEPNDGILYDKPRHLSFQMLLKIQ